MPAYTIKNWTRFQHYKHRHPPWIRLHFEMLTSSDWVMLDDASRLLAVVCMLIASKHDGQIPASCSPAYFKRIAYLDKLPNFKPLIESGFLIETLASASTSKHLRTNAYTETESETERKTPSKEQKQKKRTPAEEQFEQFWQRYPRKVGKKAAQRSFTLALNEVSLETMLAALAVDAKGWKEERFTPHPATWLNQGRYLDRPTNGHAKQDGFSAYPDTAEFKSWLHYAHDNNPALERELKKRMFEGRSFCFEAQWPPQAADEHHKTPT